MLINIKKTSLVMTVVLTLGVGIPAFADDDVTPAPAATTTTPAVAPGITANEQLPSISTKMGDTLVKDNVADEKSTFTKDTNAVYLIVTSDQVKKGQELKAVWIADDTNGVAPANYKIDEKSIAVDNAMTSGKNYIATFSLTKPTAGWPLGKYHVDIYIGDAIAKTIKFDIQ